MKNCRAFIISTSPLFIEAITRLLAEEEVEVVDQAKSVVEAQSLLNDHELDVIIVDHGDLELREAEVIPHLMNGHHHRQIVFLTMAGNEMIVYHRERVENVTPSDLIKALCVTKYTLAS